MQTFRFLFSILFCLFCDCASFCRAEEVLPAAVSGPANRVAVKQIIDTTVGDTEQWIKQEDAMLSHVVVWWQALHSGLPWPVLAQW